MLRDCRIRLQVNPCLNMQILEIFNLRFLFAIDVKPPIIHEQEAPKFKYHVSISISVARKNISELILELSPSISSCSNYGYSKYLLRSWEKLQQVFRAVQTL